jgi:hypothetical protein
MRFLIFNIVVVGALFYLFAGSQPFGAAERSGMLSKVGAVMESIVASGRRATAAVIEKVMIQNADPDAPAPAVPLPVIEVPVQKVVPPVLAKLAAPSPPAIAVSDPAVQKRRAEVLARGPVAAVKAVVAVKAGPNFMTPRQRRRELQALSEDMELLFASSRAR